MKVLLIGSTGYIGSAFKKVLTKRSINFIVEDGVIDRADPMSSISHLEDFCSTERISFIINAAGYTGKPNVDACETNQGDTMVGNVDLPQTLITVSNRLSIPWGHVSSGCLWGFTGTGEDKIYDETTRPDADFGVMGSFYSCTKALAEKLISADGTKCFVWRLRLPFDNKSSPRNYLSKLMNYDKLLNVTNSLSHRYDYVHACVDLMLSDADFGKYNVVNTGHVTTELVVEKIKEILLPDKQFSFFTNEREFYEIAAKAARSNCVLDNSKLRKHVEIRTAEDAIRDSLKNWQNG